MQKRITIRTCRHLVIAATVVLLITTVSAGFAVASIMGSTPSTLPEASDAAYSLHDEGFMTPVLKQQSSNCWAYAVISAIESNAIKNGFGNADTVKFSELQLIWTLYNRTGITSADNTLPELSGLEGDEIHPLIDEQIWILGSDFLNPAFHLMTGIGVVNETEMSDEWRNPAYLVALNHSNSIPGYFPKTPLPLEYAVNHNSYQITDFFTVPVADTTTVKEYLLKYGGGAVAYNAGAQHPVTLSDDNLPGFSGLACYQDDIPYYDHLSVIAGWNDTFPKTVFPENSRPENDGAWLIKGSWGTDYGDNGYYWISYEDASLSDVIFFNGTPADANRHLYQYDGGIGSSDVMSFMNLTIQNNFTAECNETLTAVSIYTPKTQAYRLSILVNENETTNQSGIFDVPGYYTILLDTPVTLNESDAFAIAVGLTAYGNYGEVSCDIGRTGSGYLAKTQSKAGQGVLSWYDPAIRKNIREDLKSKETSYITSSGMNFRIKAVTQRPGNEEPVTEN